MSIPENFISFRVERHPNDVRSKFLVDFVVKYIEVVFSVLIKHARCMPNSYMIVSRHICTSKSRVD